MTGSRIPRPVCSSFNRIFTKHRKCCWNRDPGPHSKAFISDNQASPLHVIGSLLLKNFVQPSLRAATYNFQNIFLSFAGFWAAKSNFANWLSSSNPKLAGECSWQRFGFKIMHGFYHLHLLRGPSHSLIRITLMSFWGLAWPCAMLQLQPKRSVWFLPFILTPAVTEYPLSDVLIPPPFIVTPINKAPKWSRKG